MKRGEIEMVTLLKILPLVAVKVNFLSMKIQISIPNHLILSQITKCSLPAHLGVRKKNIGNSLVISYHNICEPRHIQDYKLQS